MHAQVCSATLRWLHNIIIRGRQLLSATDRWTKDKRKGSKWRIKDPCPFYALNIDTQATLFSCPPKGYTLTKWFSQIVSTLYVLSPTHYQQSQSCFHHPLSQSSYSMLFQALLSLLSISSSTSTSARQTHPSFHRSMNLSVSYDRYCNILCRKLFLLFWTRNRKSPAKLQRWTKNNQIQPTPSLMIK